MATHHVQKLLRAYSSQADVLRELEAYILPAFCTPGSTLPATVPEDLSLVEAWEGYLDESRNAGVFATLRQHLVQFRFPIRAGISETAAYRQVTRQGRPPETFAEATGLTLGAPDELRLFLYNSPAGRLPVLVAGDRADFVMLIQALCYRNEPHPVPDSMGAALIKGLNNWDRVRRLRQRTPFGGADWVQQSDQYQDSLIVLSRIPYSNVSAEAMNMVEADWIAKSMRIRLAHEGAHYFTLRHFGRMHVNMYDELIADYAGIRAVLPCFRADWFLRFIGLADYPHLRTDGRLRNYLGQPPISPSARQCLQAILRDAAWQLEIFDQHVDSTTDVAFHRQLWTICQHHLLEIAMPDGHERLLRIYHHHQQSLRHENRNAI